MSSAAKRIAKLVEPVAVATQEATPADFDLQHLVAGGETRPPLVPPGGVFEGQVVVQGDTRIDGTVRGSVRGPGRLEIAPGGRIEGVVECGELLSLGAVIGPVVADRRALLGPGCAFEGTLDAPRVAMAETANWSGIARVGE